MVPSDTAICSVGQFVQGTPLVSPARGSLEIKNYWFFCPRRIVDPNFEEMISGYYQAPSGSNTVSLVNKPNLMLNFAPIRSLAIQNPEITNSLRSLFGTGTERTKCILPYLHYNSVQSDGEVRIPSQAIELAPILAFWKIYFDYFVDENIGISLPAKEGIDTARRVNDRGSLEDVDRLFTYDDLLDLFAGFTTTSPSSAPLSLGDLIEKGGTITPILNGGITALYVYDFLLRLPNVTWSKDYFTSALPWAQKGSPVSVPLSGDFDVSAGNVTYTSNIPTGKYNLGINQTGTTGQLQVTDQLTPNNQAYNLTGQVKGQVVTASPTTGILINDLRASIRMQEWLERNARGGNRYIEMIRSHFGVRSSDARLQRPEFLGGGKSPVMVSELMQTSSTTPTSPLGTPVGTASGFNKSRTIKYFAEEYGFLINISFIVPKAFYFQGRDRRMVRSNFYDFYFPEFANLGEQAVSSQELFNNSDSGDSALFGYQSRYSEYKHRRNSLCGDFTTSSLAWQSWLFGVRKFSSTPTLSPSFLSVSPALQPTLNSPFPNTGTQYGGDHFVVDNYIKMKMIRPMPKYGTPLL